MSVSDMHSLIRGHWNTSVATGVGAVSTAWDNQPFDKPGAKPANNSPYTTFAIHPGNTFQASMAPAGDRMIRHPGEIIAMFCVPKLQGDDSTADFFDKISAAFGEVTRDGVVYQTPYQVRQGLSQGWYITTVHVPFYFDLIR